MYRLLYYLLFGVLFFVHGGAHAQSIQPIPLLSGRVIDRANVLSIEEESRIESKLKALEVSKGAQVVVLTVPSTIPETIEQFTLRVVEEWKLGREKADDGALLALAMNDRTMRIEVGHGLEGALTDITSKRILEDILKPYLRDGKYGDGISAAVDSIIKVIEGEELPAVTSRQAPPDAESQIMLLVFTGLFVSALLSLITTKVKAGSISTLFVVLTGLALTSVMVAFIAAIIVFVLSISNGSSNFSSGRSSRGGWSSGGGFRGGGGSFGGGGASSRW